MSDYEKRINANMVTHNVGLKYDENKPDLTLIPRIALEQEAFAMMFGARKYGRDNYKLGMSKKRLLAAAMRHIVAYTDGETNDQESGVDHLGHARACLGMIMELIRIKKDME